VMEFLLINHPLIAICADNMSLAEFSVDYRTSQSVFSRTVKPKTWCSPRVRLDNERCTARGIRFCQSCEKTTCSVSLIAAVIPS
jgi:hypothetical protein